MISFNQKETSLLQDAKSHESCASRSTTAMPIRRRIRS